MIRDIRSWHGHLAHAISGYKPQAHRQDAHATNQTREPSQLRQSLSMSNARAFIRGPIIFPRASASQR